jgi:hypothetical protein
MTDEPRSAPPPPQSPAAAPQPYRDPDEINLLEYAYALVKAKWWIVGMSVLGLVGGYITARIKGPSYVATAVIAPRETESQKTPNLSGLGMFGGVVASQLNLGGNASLEKLDIVLDSRKFNAEMLERAGLLPLLHKHEWPDRYEENWDTAAGRWRVDSLVIPPRKAAGYITSELVDKEIDKNNTMTITVEHGDSLFADTLLSAALRHLDDYVKLGIQEEARENRDFLESQLRGVSDPLLRQKIQELIAAEVERMMVVSKEAFAIVDPVYVAKSFREKKLYPLVFGFGLCFLTVLAVVFRHALVDGEKTEEDKELLARIGEELKTWPFGKNRG